MNIIKNNLIVLRKGIPNNVKLVAVSKTKTEKELLEAYNCGQRIFGENKIQEMSSKFENLPKDIEWHMIGHVQTNKVKYMAPFVHTIHSVDRIKLLLFTLSGLVCGIAGILTTSRLAVARFNMATGAELEIVLMVMLGGTYIFGGRGNIFGTFVAFWIVVILRAGLNVARIKIESQLTILGAMLIIAIILTNYIYSKSQK